MKNKIKFKSGTRPHASCQLLDQRARVLHAPGSFFYFIFLRLLCPETEKTGRDNPRLSRMDLSFPGTKNNKFTWVLIVIE
jgi:hypothetical protein